MRVRLADTGFDPWRLIQEHQTRRLTPGTYGATASFVGTMRDFNADADVEGMFLEYYPGMTERELERIVAAAMKNRQLLDALVVHRVGQISPGEPIVLVVVWSAHRHESFDACREIMEALKSRAPFWKREQRNDGPRWVMPADSGRKQ